MSSPTGKGPGTPAPQSKILATAVSNFAAPIYRGTLNHGAIAELQEGFRILTNGQKVHAVPTADLLAAMQGAGMHTSEEELQELLRVVHQDERTDGLEYPEFVELMTREVDDSFAADLRQAFALFDKSKKGTVTKKQFTEMFVTMGEHSSAEELEELLMLAGITEDSETVDYNAFIGELMVRLHKV